MATRRPAPGGGLPRPCVAAATARTRRPQRHTPRRTVPGSAPRGRPGRGSRRRRTSPSGAALELGLLLEPLAFELRQLLGDIGLVEQQRLEGFLLVFFVNVFAGKARFDLDLPRVQA